MKLELGYIDIKDIQFASESKVENGVIYVNAEELKALLLEDEHIASVELDIARPGESVRIMPVKDVIEPRVKVEGPGNIFPGTLAKVEAVGSGRTNVLRGSAIVTTGKIVARVEGGLRVPKSRYTRGEEKTSRKDESAPSMKSTKTNTNV